MQTVCRAQHNTSPESAVSNHNPARPLGGSTVLHSPGHSTQHHPSAQHDASRKRGDLKVGAAKSPWQEAPAQSMRPMSGLAHRMLSCCDACYRTVMVPPMLLHGPRTTTVATQRARHMVWSKAPRRLLSAPTKALRRHIRSRGDAPHGRQQHRHVRPGFAEEACISNGGPNPA